MIEQIVSGFPYKPEKGCFGFASCILIRDSKNILFDTGGYNVRSVIKSYLNDIDCVVISHLHFDHCSNLDLFIEKKIPIYISTKELISYYENKDNDFDLFSYFECIKDKLNIIEIDNVFQLSNKVKIIFTLGHTNGHISLEVVDGSKLVLLAGDSIKSYNDYIDTNSYGNAVNPKKYLDTKKTIKKKYDIIYPGHDSVIINGKRGIQLVEAILKKKIAICIPTYNECKNIENTTRKIDTCLKKYSRLGFETIIVNADNNSDDNTNAKFNKLKTTSKKVSLISNKIGKGNNLLNFFKFCDKENIDYALTIDADVKSLKPIWIDKYLKELIQGKKDYVTPIYQRSRYEGSTTNHFAFPIVFITTGKPIRQPIAGDFAFNLKFVRLLLKYKVNESIRQYGIDIFMTMIACYNNLNVSQINLDKKIHNPSNGKMEKMFGEVLDAFLYIWKQLIKEHPFEYWNIEKICISSDNSILSTRKFNHKKEAIILYKKYENKLSSSITKNIEDVWINIIVKVIKNPYSITSIKKEEVKSTFIFRAVSFWLKSERYSSKYCEELILKQVKKINKQMKGI